MMAVLFLALIFPFINANVELSNETAINLPDPPDLVYDDPLPNLIPLPPFLPFGEQEQEPVETFSSSNSVCAVSFDQASLNFGSLFPNTDSNEVVIVLTNDGDLTASINTLGSVWRDQFNFQKMNVEQTAYSLGSSDFDSKTPLTNSLVFVGNILTLNQLDINFQLRVIALSGFSGQLDQTIGINVICT